MEYSKREKKYINTGIIFNVILILSAMFYIISQNETFGKIEDKKDNLGTLIETRNNIKKSGLNFNDFKSLALKSNNLTTQSKKVLLEIDNNFYKKNFSNSKEYKNYSDFLEKQKENIGIINESNFVQKRKKVMNNLIPLFSKKVLLKDGLDTHSFITYIERVLYSFELETESNIGIGDFTIIEDEIISLQKKKKKKLNSLESEIFYFPLTLELTGKKRDIVDFLHFVENIGKVESSSDNLGVKNDNYFSGRNTKRIDGYQLKERFYETGKFKYNIYYQQLALINNLNIKNYIDSHASTENNLKINNQKGKNFTNYIKKDQGKEPLTIELTINFYVKGIPNYKIEEKLTQINKTRNNIEKSLKKLSNRTKSKKFITASAGNKSIKNRIEEVLDIILLLKDEIDELKQDFKEGKNLEIVFSKSIYLENKLKSIEKFTNENEEKVKTQYEKLKKKK